MTDFLDERFFTTFGEAAAAILVAFIAGCCMHGFTQFVIGLFMMAWVAVGAIWDWITGERRK